MPSSRPSTTTPQVRRRVLGRWRVPGSVRLPRPDRRPAAARRCCSRHRSAIGLFGGGDQAFPAVAPPTPTCSRARHRPPDPLAILPGEPWLVYASPSRQPDARRPHPRPPGCDPTGTRSPRPRRPTDHPDWSRDGSMLAYDSWSPDEANPSVRPDRHLDRGRGRSECPAGHDLRVAVPPALLGRVVAGRLRAGDDPLRPGTRTGRGVRARSSPGPSADEVLFRLERAGAGCDAGALGRYRWQIADDGLHLKLVAVEDPCAARAEAFARTWTRSHNGLTAGGEGVVTGVGPLVQVTLPEGSYTQRDAYRRRGDQRREATPVALPVQGPTGVRGPVRRDAPAGALEARREGVRRWDPREPRDDRRAGARHDDRRRARDRGHAQGQRDVPGVRQRRPVPPWTLKAAPEGGWWLSAGLGPVSS